MKSWRPENWENPHKEWLKQMGGCETDRGEFVMPPPIPGVVGAEIVELALVRMKDVEAGADAMLAALKKEGMYCYPHSFFDADGLEIWTKAGWQVFLEDESK